MKPNQDQVEDQLLDALLHEQNRGDREQALADIEAALNGGSQPYQVNVRPMWPRRLGIIAASVALGGMTVLWMNANRKEDQVLAMNEVPKSSERERSDLLEAIRAQEDVVEERRKELTKISRSKDITYRGEGDVMSRRTLESDDGQLRQLRKLPGGNDAAVDQSVAANEPRPAPSSSPLAGNRILGGGLPEEIAGRDMSDSRVDEVGRGTGARFASPYVWEPRSIRIEPHGNSGLRSGDVQAAYSVDQTRMLEIEKNNLEAQIQSLLKYDSEQLLTYASGLDLPDNTVKSLTPQYLELKRQVDVLKASGLGNDHPTVVSNQRVLNAMKEQLDEGVVNLRTRLQGQLEMSNERLAKSRRGNLNEDAERYGKLIDPTWQRPTDAPLSTFSIDVDTASYANIRRMIREGRAIPADAVRIEECINAFKYHYETPADGEAFAVHTELATCPWNENNMLVKVGIKGREIAREKRPVSNLVFLIDVSGSMQGPNRLPLVKESLKILLNELDERDSVSYVVYAGREGVVLAPTKMTESGRVEALQALEKLEAGGSTNGGAGITRAYQLAQENFIEGGVNRVILASDGDFNVGVTSRDALVSLVKERAAKNIYLSALAFGTGNLNDSMFEAISNDGNGNYFYIDGIREARKVFLENLTGSLITIAKDVKIQVEFNPAKVGSYRLIGYANRVLKDEDFNNDKVDAGDIGAGHTVTAFYEIVPAGMPLPNAGGVDPLKYQKPTPEAKAPAAEPSDEWLTLKLRHKHPEGDISALQERVVKGEATPWQKSGTDFQFAAAVAMFGMKLRGMEDVSEYPWDSVRQLGKPGLRDDKNEDRAEFMELIGELEKRSR